MSISSRSRLLALTAREFRQVTGERPKEPAQRSFKPMRLSLDTFGRGWDARRGSAMRLAAILLREDDQALERRICADEPTAATYADASGWLAREAAYLRKTARLLDKTVGRLNVVLQRCRSRSEVAERG